MRKSKTKLRRGHVKSFPLMPDTSVPLVSFKYETSSLVEFRYSREQRFTGIRVYIGFDVRQWRGNLIYWSSRWQCLQTGATYAAKKKRNTFIFGLYSCRFSFCDENFIGSSLVYKRQRPLDQHAYLLARQTSKADCMVAAVAANVLSFLSNLLLNNYVLFRVELIYGLWDKN